MISNVYMDAVYSRKIALQSELENKFASSQANRIILSMLSNTTLT